MTNLKHYYLTTIIPKFIKKFKFINLNQIPKINKIIVNRGLGIYGQNHNFVQKAIEELYIITHQQPNITSAKKSIVPFKIKKGNPIGLKITLHNYKMYNFLEKLIHIIFPRIQDFHGLKITHFDKNGNYNFGFNNQFIFSELDYEKIEQKRGLNISIILNSNLILYNIFLLKNLGFPLII